MTDVRIWRAGIKAMRLFCDEVEATFNERKDRSDPSEDGGGSKRRNPPEPFKRGPLRSVDSLFSGKRKDWDQVLEESRGKEVFFLGEYVREGKGMPRFLLQDAGECYSMAFVGMSGSGKTESMKATLTHYLTNTVAEVHIADLKGTREFDVFQSARCPVSIGYDSQFALEAIEKCFDAMKERQAACIEHRARDIDELATKKGGGPYSRLLLVIDELPVLLRELGYDRNENKPGTPANKLFTLLTRGRSMGIRIIVSSQFGNYDYIPPSIGKNIATRVIFRTGSSGEANLWLDGDLPFKFGKGMVTRPDGRIDSQRGQACVGSVENHVAFWYLTDAEIQEQLEAAK